MVASLIRQESEFNPNAVSRANAYGLMQLLPSVGKSMAREEGLTKFQTFQLLDPETNIRLGTRYLRQMIDRFGGVEEYALAAYNAGPGAVDRFGGIPNFRETRNYVQKVTSSYFRPGANRESSAYEQAPVIYRSTDSSGRVIFVNE